MKFKQMANGLSALFRVKGQQITVFYPTDDLHPVIIKTFIKSCQLQSRTIDFFSIDNSAVQIDFRQNIFQIKMFQKFLD